MKITGRNIKRRLYGLKSLPKNLKRARYFRGHGVHSPFVYTLVREVFMCREFLTPERGLFQSLCACGVSERRAKELQNLLYHCSYNKFLLDPSLEQAEGCDIVILSMQTSPQKFALYAEKAHLLGITLCILSPSFDKERDMACRALVEGHRCTSVDNRGYLLLFNNYLPVQRFRL